MSSWPAVRFKKWRTPTTTSPPPINPQWKGRLVPVPVLRGAEDEPEVRQSQGRVDELAARVVQVADLPTWPVLPPGGHTVNIVIKAPIISQGIFQQSNYAPRPLF
jgi:hypothetical protein